MKFRIFHLLVPLMFLVTLGCQDRAADRKGFLESAEAFHVRGQYRKAIIEYSNALQLGRDVSVLIGLAKSHDALGNHDAAIANFRRVLEIDENQIEAQLAVGRAVFDAARRDSSHFKEVRKFAENILTRSPDTKEAQLWLAYALAAERSATEAEIALVQARADHPGSLEIALALGRVYQKTGQVSEAEKLVSRTRATASQIPTSAPWNSGIFLRPFGTRRRKKCSEKLSRSTRENRA